jgi:F420-non-reducing hydrogenase small subunit
MMRFVYEESPSTQNPERAYPTPALADQGRLATLPTLWHVVRSLDQVIPVDYYLPGCPPTPKLLSEALGALLRGQAPPAGSVLAPDIALCEQCPRKETKPTDLAIREFKRPHLAPVDPTQCLLAQGFVCMGPSTRAGCEAACIGGNMPCSGCFGPTSRVRDQGAKMLSSACSAIAATDESEIQAAVDTIPDPVGTFYRYGLAASLLRRRADLQV